MPRVISFEEALDIRRQVAGGVPRRELAWKYGVGLETISRIVRGETHVKAAMVPLGDRGAGTVAEEGMLQRLLRVQAEVDARRDGNE